MTKRLEVRISDNQYEKIEKEYDNKSEFVREAIREKLARISDKPRTIPESEIAGMELARRNAEKEAGKLCKEDTVVTDSLNIAEVLVKKHGYQVVTVKAGDKEKGIPKRWHLRSAGAVFREEIEKGFPENPRDPRTEELLADVSKINEVLEEIEPEEAMKLI